MWGRSNAAPLKPQNQSGMTCPLLKKPCGEVCHTCEFWEPLQVTITGQGDTQMWKCAFVWTTTLASVNNIRLEGLQQAWESLRNVAATAIRGAISRPQVAPPKDVTPLIEHDDAGRTG